MELNKRAMKLWNKHDSVTDQILPRAGKLHWKNTLQYCITRPQAQRNSRGANTGAQLRMARLQAPLRGKDKVIIHSPHWTMLKVPTVRFVGKRFMTKLASCNLCKIFKRNILLFLKLLFGCGATTPFARLKMIYTSRIKIPWVYVTAKPFAIN